MERDDGEQGWTMNLHGVLSRLWPLPHETDTRENDEKQIVQDGGTVGIEQFVPSSRDHGTRCPDCRSPRVETHDACPNCESVAVERHDVLEHFDCGCVQPRSAFETDSGYACPECRTKLGTLGVDFARVGVVYDCTSCSSRFGASDRAYTCLECENATEEQVVQGRGAEERVAEKRESEERETKKREMELVHVERRSE